MAYSMTQVRVKSLIDLDQIPVDSNHSGRVQRPELRKRAGNSTVTTADSNHPLDS